jgi:hypothetical protein
VTYNEEKIVPLPISIPCSDQYAARIGRKTNVLKRSRKRKNILKRSFFHALSSFVASCAESVIPFLAR